MENEDPWKVPSSGAETNSPSSGQETPQGAPNWEFASPNSDARHDDTQQHEATSLWNPATVVDSGRSNKGRTAQIIGAVVVLIALCVGSGAAGAEIEHHNNSGKATTVTGSPVSVAGGGSTSASQQLAKVAAAVQPSVVSITVTNSNSEDEGSGIILTSDGTILTNNHVVSAAAQSGSISVKFSSGKTANATIVGRDPSSDIAVIKASGVSGLTPATLGSTSSLHVGDTVLAIGSPLGLDGSVTSGIVSALHRTVDLSSEEQQEEPDQGGLGGLGNLFGGGGNDESGQSSNQASSTSVGDAIQTDAAINPGNSGGALVDISGDVVGINTAIASTGNTNGNIGVGFAIPIEEAKSVANQLMNGQTPKHALLGVEIDDQNSGAVVADVTNGGAADAAGIQVGDIITKVDAQDVDDGTSLAAIIRSHQPGDKVTITYTRGGQSHSTQVTLGAAAS
jgi:putative serine protease PepD